MAVMSSYYNEQISELQEQAARAKRDEANKKTADEIRALYQAYIEAGFTEEQAWEIFITQLKK